MDFAGHDDLGRRVYLAFCERLEDVATLAFPDAPCVFFLGADSAETSVDVLHALAENVLERGAVYVLAWGAGAERFEDIVDEVFVMRTLGGDAPVVMTTSHAKDSLHDALRFAVQLARPAEEYADACRTMIVVLAQNVNWYNEAQNALEDLLR